MTLGLLAGLVPGHDHASVSRWLDDLSDQAQMAVIGVTLGMLFLCALVMAQIGLIGIALYFIAVVLVVR